MVLEEDGNVQLWREQKLQLNTRCLYVQQLNVWNKTDLHIHIPYRPFKVTNKK